MFYPEVQEIPYQDPLTLFAPFAKEEGALFLDSAELRPQCGQYSFIAIDPFQTLISKNGSVVLNGKKYFGNPWEILRAELQNYRTLAHPLLPSFQGGVAGLFSYELYQHLENIPRVMPDDLAFPDCAIGFYDLVIAFDLIQRRAWIFSNGFPFKNNERKTRAHKRLAWLINKITSPLPLAPFFKKPLVLPHAIQSHFDATGYVRAVQKVIDYIYAGDIFEANISQQFKASFPATGQPFDLYQRLRHINPAPFAAFFQIQGSVIVSASPERFLKLQAGNVETRPIKGTRPRGKTKLEDEKLKAALLQSEKDQAENIMIVDLLRNDLSRVCEDHSILVPQLCGLESYQSVHHLVSIVTGKIAAAFSALDLLQVAFPGGSITGAPKIRAMEIIAEIEPMPRGPYCGSMAYIDFNGNMDSSILIRSFAIKKETVTFQAGGAVVLDSDPQSEYEESLAKAYALHEALTRDFTD